MKLYITSNAKVDLSELADFGIEYTLNRTTKKLKTEFNPYFNQMWGDFDFVRSLAPKKGYDARCFITSLSKLRNYNIKGHLGMYDMLDRDGILDFYAGVPTRLDKRAKANGFKTNEAWLIVHELCHGLAQKYNQHDATHAMEKQGRLKEYYEMLRKELLKNKLTLLETIVGLYKTIFAVKQQTGTKPRVNRAIESIKSEMAMLGHPVRVVEGYRSLERQSELYAQGRATPGNIVTNARAGESYHNYGVAADFVFRKEGYDASEELWQTLGTVGKKYGFEWGGDWSSFKDKPHFQMPLSYSLTDFQKDRVDYKKYL